MKGTNLSFPPPTPGPHLRVDATVTSCACVNTSWTVNDVVTKSGIGEDVPDDLDRVSEPKLDLFVHDYTIFIKKITRDGYHLAVERGSRAKSFELLEEFIFVGKGWTSSVFSLAIS